MEGKALEQVSASLRQKDLSNLTRTWTTNHLNTTDEADNIKFKRPTAQSIFGIWTSNPWTTAA